MAQDRRRRARARLIKAGSSAVISLATLLLTGCPPDLNTGGTSTRFNLAVISNADNTKNHPSNTPFSVNARVSTGRRLFGRRQFLLAAHSLRQRLPVHVLHHDVHERRR